MPEQGRQSGLGERTAARAAPVLAWVVAALPVIACVLIAVVLQLFIKPHMGDFYAKMLLDIGTNVILAVSLTMVNGFTGQFSMGHAAFMAVGAYVAAGLVYYGSARLFNSDDFADAGVRGGVLSTGLLNREIPIAGGTVQRDDSLVEFALAESVVLPADARYRVRLDTDDGKGKTLRLEVIKEAYSPGDRILIADQGYALSHQDWIGADGHIVLLPAWISRGDVIFCASLLAGGLAAALCGYLVGLPSLRLKGDYLAIVTLGFGEIVRVLIQSQTTDTLYDPAQIAETPVWKLPRYLGGPVGFSGLPFYSSLFWAWLFAGLTLLVAYRLKRGTFGRAFLSIREDEIAAEAMGIHTTKYKVRAFVIAAFFAGIAGGIYAHTVGVQLNAGELGFVKSFDIIIMVVLGGMGSISGSALAAFILTILPELLRKPAGLSAILPFAAAALVAGIVLWVLHRKRTNGWRSIGKLLAVLGGLGTLLGGLAFWAQCEHIELTQYRMVLFALGLILMMLLRPEGLFGLKEVWELRLPGGKKGGRG